MALCDRVVSQKFKLRRKLTALSAAGAIAHTPQGPLGASSTRFVSQPVPPEPPEVKASLADPGLPEDHPRQLAHLLMTSVGLSFLVYGPGDALACYCALSNVVPALLDTESYSGSYHLSILPNRAGLYWLCFQGPLGSVIAICVAAEADSDFATKHIAMPLRNVEKPWHWGIGTIGGAVPAEFARIVDSSEPVEMYGPGGPQHMRPGAPPVYPQYVEPGTAPPYDAYAPTSPHPYTTAPVSGLGHARSDATPYGVAASGTPYGAPAATGQTVSRHWALIATAVIAVIVVCGGVAMLRSHGGSSTRVSGAGVMPSTVSVASVSPCSPPPTLQPQSTNVGPGGLTVSTIISPGCSTGDLLTNSSLRVTAVDAAGRDVASGIFDLSSTPIAVGSGGATAQFTFTAGAYWRTPDSMTGQLRMNRSQRRRRPVGERRHGQRFGDSGQRARPPESGSIDAAARSALADIAAADRADIDANLLNVWQPQLSSKRPGLFADWISWSALEIVREHMQLRQRFPGARLVWSGDWSVYGDPTWWVTVAGVPFGSGEEANGWCAAQGFDADHCFAKILSHNMGASGTSLNRKYGSFSLRYACKP
jgi:hypothetical protein